MINKLSCASYYRYSPTNVIAFTIAIITTTTNVITTISIITTTLDFLATAGSKLYYVTRYYVYCGCH